MDAGTYGYYFLGASAFEFGTDYPGMLNLTFDFVVTGQRTVSCLPRFM